MKIFLYEYVTGGGFVGESADSVPLSLVAEGRAMISALAADCAEIASAEVAVMSDSRFSPPILATNTLDVDSPAAEEAVFRELAAQADATIVIAPEFDRLLEQRVAWVLDSGGRLLGPCPDAIALAADKHRTAVHLATAAVPTTVGIALKKGSYLPVDFRYPAVLKPRHGAGSQSLQLIRDEQAVSAEATQFSARLEQYVPGIAASVAVLCGPHAVCPLMPCRQLISDDGRFEYLGGSMPLAYDLADRARGLAMAAVRSIDNMLGYVGVDVILGERPEDDVVVEINPRLTTSYVGLRSACKQNLAQVMFDIYQGHDVVPTFSDAPLQFDSKGRTLARSIS